MELTFEFARQLADGHNPAGYHDPSGVFRLLYTDGADTIKQATAEIPYGRFGQFVLNVEYYGDGEYKYYDIHIVPIEVGSEVITVQDRVPELQVLGEDYDISYKTGTIYFFEAPEDGKLVSIEYSYAEPEFSEGVNLIQSDAVDYYRVTYFPRIYTFHQWLSAGKHWLVIEPLKADNTPYLTGGSIRYDNDQASAGLSLTLENPGNKLASGRSSSLLLPGTQISIWFSMGDSERIEIGRFYVDKVRRDTTSETIDVEARNLIGKLLRDQTFDEANTRAALSTATFFGDILERAGAASREIQDEAEELYFEFPKDNALYDGIMEALDSSFINWRMREEPDGTIIIGHRDFEHFTESEFTFFEGQCISRSIEWDDDEVYSRIAVQYKWKDEPPVDPETGGVQFELEYMNPPVGPASMARFVHAPLYDEQVVGEDLNIYIGGSTEEYILDPANYTINTNEWRVNFHEGYEPAEHEAIRADYIALPYKADKELIGTSYGGFTQSKRLKGRPIKEGSVTVYINEGDGVQEYPKQPSRGPDFGDPPEDNWEVNLSTGMIYVYYVSGSSYASYETTLEEETGAELPEPEEGTEEFYQDVQFRSGWNLPQRKTKYINLPDNSDPAEAQAKVAEIAELYENAGVREQILAPFTPHLQVGDEAKMIRLGETEPISLGIVMTVEHQFGKGGFATQFTVDSGGILGKPRLSKYIEQIVNRTTRDRAQRIEVGGEEEEQ